MRLLLVVNDASGGGAEAVAESWRKSLEALGHVVELGRCGHPQLDREQPPAALARRSNEGSIRLVLRFAGLLRREKYDAVITVATYPNLVVLLARLLARADVRVLISEHVLPSVYLRGKGASRHAQIVAAKVLYRRADAAVAVSHAVAADLVVSYAVPADRCLVLPNPVVNNDVDRPARSQRDRRERSVTLLCAGRLVSEKQPGLVLDVHDQLVREGWQVETLYIGDGPLSGELQEAIQSRGLSGRVLPWSSNWASTAPNDSVVINVSYIEGLSNILIEAASHGLPVVAPSAALGVADAILPGVTGFLYNSYRPAAIARAVSSAVALDVSAPSGWISLFSEQQAGAALDEWLRTGIESA